MDTLFAALYVRVSTEEQARDGLSIDAQTEDLQDYCTSNGIRVYRTYVDAGISGASLNRPELQWLLDDAQNGKFQKVIIWRLSRLSRSQTDLLTVVNMLKSNNITLHSLTEQLDATTPHGFFSLQMMGAAAQFEREQISENVKLGSLHRVRQGKWNCGNNVLGYRWLQGTDSNEGRTEIVPEEAELVRYIFERYATGQHGYKAITNLLNKQGYRTKKGLLFTISSVRNILTNRNYIGKIRFNVTENRRTKGSVPVEWVDGEQEPILTFKLWEQAQAVLARNSRTPVRLVSRNYPLTGLLKCPQCGGSMVACHTKAIRKNGSVKRNHYYVCGRFTNSGAAACRTNAIRADDAEMWVFDQMQRLLCSPFALQEISLAIGRKQDTTRIPLLEKLDSLKYEQERLLAEQSNLFQAYESSRITREELAQRLTTIKTRNIELAEEMHHTERRIKLKPVETVSISKIRAALEQISAVFKADSQERLKQVLSLFIEKISLPLDRCMTKAILHGTDALYHLTINENWEDVQHG
ncbi:recombinase family protein [Paenibacillus whitsoniae]|uniref:Recombinase family protein n=1 Tax=Paenibacillus whitsoniae TaxID=2496558 RepID=A0A430J4B2_9BACL|nr:recombinase family protein [Paenibacillus whitsoniae]RTE01750.1 recombinase family protein [Paenibacillus whitsoniae]